MKKGILCLLILCSLLTAKTQNVFNITDPIVRLDKTKGYGSAQYPDTNRLGLQKYVSIATTGITGTWDATSFKAYYLNINGTKIAFRLKFPRSYTTADSAAKKYPMMMFLHGAGEGGCPSNGGIYNNEKQLWLGGNRFKNTVDNNGFDGFLIYPQLVNSSTCSAVWGNTDVAHLNILMSIVDSLVKYTRADIDRLMLNGLSGGGYAIWRMLGAFPQRIAKAIPSASAGTVGAKALFVHIPIWFATGGKDTDPSPAAAQYNLTQLQQIGADVRYTLYPNLGHAVWESHWAEPDYVPAMNDMHKANPLVFFQHNEYCANQTIDAKLGITAGFYAYEWQKDNSTIATSTNGVKTINQPAFVTSFTGNEIIINAYGTYKVRFKRTAASAWTVFSPKPVVIKNKTTTQAPPISINGIKSNVLPAPDGSTTVPLQMPAGYINYEWFRSSDNVKVASTQIYNAPAGIYKARYSEQYGCGTNFSPDYTVVNAAGTPSPDAPTNPVTTALSQTTVKIDWSQASAPASNETGFEVYRGTKSGGPFALISLTAANAVTYTDTALIAGTSYFYKVRAVNSTGGSATTIESSVKTLSDNQAPAAPANLQYRGSNQSSVMLRWTAPADNDINRYDIFVNGTKAFSTTATAFTVINLDSLKSYTFTVKAIDNVGNVSPASNQVSGYTHRQGINYKYYTGTWTTLPNFNGLVAAKSGITDTVNINNTAIKTATNRYGFLWQGFIYVPVAATYTFETISDDGSKVYIDVPYASNATAVVNNDGSHTAQSRTGTATLTQGYHSIAVTYFQNTNTTYDMQLFWSNNAGQARERIQKNFFAYVNGAGAAPAVPSALAATATAFNKIRLTWTDNSNNETGFEVVRSLTTNGTFTTVGTAAANATSYTDSGLTAAKAYFYKIRAVSASGESPYTAQATATTPNAPATPIAPSGLSVTSAATSMSVSWNDNATNETGYKVYRSDDNITFGSIATLGVNANAYTDADVTVGHRYYYYVTSVNAAGESDPSNTSDGTVGDGAPIIGSLNNLVVKSYATGMEDFTVTDNPGDIITVSIPNKPSFITLTNNGTDYQIKAKPSVNNIGTYQLTVAATDNHGNTSTMAFSLIVTDRNTLSVFVNFGSATSAASAPWNNWLGARAANQIISGLKDEANNTTALSLITVTAWAALTDMGHITGNNSGVAPDAVLQSGLADNNPSRILKVMGLNPAKLYNLVFIGSQNEGLPATTQYSVGTQSVQYDARYNTNTSANLSGLTPDGTGSLLITVTKTGSTFNTYLSGMIIEEMDPSVTLLNPANLYAEAVDRSTVNLTWSDRTINETGYEIIRATDSLFTANVVSIPVAANTTSYKNTGLAADTRYWYRVRALSIGGSSEFANQVRVVTPGSLIYVNFNTTTPNAAAPWNNLVADPTTMFTAANLKNQSSVATAISMRVEQPFNGEFTAGVNTGNNSGVVPDNVLISDYWLDNGQTCQVRLTGLSHAKRYRIGFVGSAGSAGWFRGNYITTYTVNQKTVYLNSWMNSMKMVYLDGLVPNAAGELLISYGTTAATMYGFTSGFVLQEFTDRQEDGSIPSNLMLDPSDQLAAVPANRSKISAYPNPFTDFIMVDLDNPVSNQKISAELYDMQGRLTDRQVFEHVPLGANTLRIRTTSRSTGTLMLVLRTNSELLKTIKMIRARP